MNLSFAEKLLAVRLFFSLAFWQMQLSTKPFKEVLQGIEIRTNFQQEPVQEKERTEKESTEKERTEKEYAERVGRLIEQVAGHTPWESNCLTRAVCCGRQLQLKNIPYKFHFGTRLLDGSLEAHAWVTVGENIVCGAVTANKYQEITHFDLASVSFESASLDALRMR